MFGTYGWNAGATQAHIFADLAALVCGAAVDDLSASCNKAASNVAGEASGWSVLDADSYVIARAGQAGGPGMQAQFGAQASQYVGVRAVEAFNTVTNLPGGASSYLRCSGAMAVAGRVNIYANASGLAIASADFADVAIVGEVKRGSPVFAGDALAPGSFIADRSYTYMPRIKSNSALGDVMGANCVIAGAYGSMGTTAARTRTDTLYLPIVPLMLSASSFPVGECSGLVAVGGYGASGDTVTDNEGSKFVLLRCSVMVGFPQR